MAVPRCYCALRASPVCAYHVCGSWAGATCLHVRGVKLCTIVLEVPAVIAGEGKWIVVLAACNKWRAVVAARSGDDV